MKRHLFLFSLLAGTSLCASAQTMWLEEIGNDYEFRQIFYDENNNAENVHVVIDDGYEAAEYEFIYYYDGNGNCTREDCYQLGVFGEDIFAYYTKYEYDADNRLQRRITANYIPFKEPVPVEGGYYYYNYDDEGNLASMTCQQKVWASLDDKENYTLTKVDSVAYKYNSLGILSTEMVYRYLQNGQPWNYSSAIYQFMPDGRIKEKAYKQFSEGGQLISDQREVWEYNRDKSLKTYTDEQWMLGEFIPAIRLEYFYLDNPEAEEYIVTDKLPYIIDGLDLDQPAPVDYLDLWVATEDTHELVFYETIEAKYTTERPHNSVGETAAEVSFSVFSTVTEGTLHMECSERLPFEIYDMQGRLAAKGTSVVGTIDISPLAEGMYVVKCGGQAVKIMKN